MSETNRFWYGEVGSGAPETIPDCTKNAESARTEQEPSDGARSTGRRGTSGSLFACEKSPRLERSPQRGS